MSSLVLGLGGGTGPYAPLELLPPSTIANVRNVVLLVIDGLGYAYLRHHGESLCKHLRGPITSVFPTSTAPAITTFITGLAPQQHAVTGWFLNLKELGTVATILPFQPRWGEVSFAAAGIDIHSIIDHPPVFNSLNAYCYYLIDQRLVDSPYSLAGAGCAERVGYRNLKHFFAAIIDVVKREQERKYIYGYWSQFDALSHEHGVGSQIVKQHLRELEHEFALLWESLSGTNTVVLVTADHGFLDTAPRFATRLEQHPELQGCLAAPLCGEPRVAYCYVRPGKTALFKRYVRERLGACCALYPSEALVHAGWFGLGEPNSRLLDRIGDYTLLTKDRYVLKDSLLTESAWTDIGVHGGSSEDEMYVPLVIVSC